MKATSSSANTFVGSAIASVRVPDALDREDLVLAGDRRGNEAQRLRVDVDVAQRDGGDAVLPREEADQLLLGDEAEARKDRAELFGLALLLGEGLPELSLGDQSLGDQEVPEAPGLGLAEFSLRHIDLLMYHTNAILCVC